MNGLERKKLEEQITNGSVDLIKKPGSCLFNERTKYHLEFADRKRYINGFVDVTSFAKYPLFDSLDYWKRYEIKDLLNGEQVGLEIE